MQKLIIIMILLFMPLWCGCDSFYTHDDYQFTVIDAEFNRPVEGATVTVGYDYFMMLNAPKRTEAITDGDGMAELRVASYECRWISVAADGYIPLKRIRIEHGWPLPDAYKKTDKREISIPIYRGPEPKVEIVVPDDYRGPVAVEYIPADILVQGWPGKRRFSYTISPSGYVGIESSPLFCQLPFKLLSPMEIQCRYENREPIIISNRDTGRVRVMRISGRRNKLLYFSGTDEEGNNLYRKIYPIDKNGITTTDFEFFNSYFE